MRKIAAAAVVAILPAAAALAQTGTEWREDLEWQMLREHACEVNYLTNVEVKGVDDAEVVFARVHCMDKRAFDVSRTRGDARFEVAECTTDVC